MTGGTVISEERGYKLENATLDYLGTADKVNIDKDNTIVVNGAGKKEDIEARVNQIKQQTGNGILDRNHLLRKIEASGNMFGLVGCRGLKPNVVDKERDCALRTFLLLWRTKKSKRHQT